MAGLIPDSELAALRASVTPVFDIPATIQRKGSATDSYGYSGGTWTPISTAGLLCGLAKPTAAVQALYAARIGDLNSWVARLPYGTDIKQNDRLIAAGQTMAVQADLSVSSYSTCITVLATEVREV